ncbi:hypothetical protein KKD03_05575 [Patescibacteria group bacterium]|nr:hypothetical protein [Patescibacteria group bacterium]
MKNDVFNPFDGLILDNYEQEIEDSIPDDWKPTDISKEEQEFFAKIAKKHIALKVSKRINIRINNSDLAKVRARAKSNNIPYQTLLSTLIHKFAQGDLKITI